MSDCKANTGIDGAGCLFVILLFWFWYIGGCEYLPQVIKEHNEAKRERALAPLPEPKR